MTSLGLGGLLFLSVSLTALVIRAAVNRTRRVEETTVRYDEAAGRLGADVVERGPLTVVYAATLDGRAFEYGHRLPQSRWPSVDPLATPGFFVRTRAAAGTRLWVGEPDQLGLTQHKWIPFGAEAPTGDASFDTQLKVFTDAPAFAAAYLSPARRAALRELWTLHFREVMLANGVVVARRSLVSSGARISFEFVDAALVSQAARLLGVLATGIPAVDVSQKEQFAQERQTEMTRVGKRALALAIGCALAGAFIGGVLGGATGTWSGLVMGAVVGALVGQFYSRQDL